VLLQAVQWRFQVLDEFPLWQHDLMVLIPCRDRVAMGLFLSSCFSKRGAGRRWVTLVMTDEATLPERKPARGTTRSSSLL